MLREGRAERLGVMVDELQEVVLSVVEDHVDRLVLQYDFLESHDILMRYFPVQLGYSSQLREPRNTEHPLTAISRIAL